MKEYNYPLALTQQFRFCGNPFRIDSYKGCSFGCKYCFASSRKGNHTFEYEVGNTNIIENIFKKAYSNKPTKDINIELIRMNIPLHFGGMSDPFQPLDNTVKNTLKILNITNKYNYPIMFSTKTSNLSKEYLDVLNPKIHCFQISLIGISEDFIKKYETNTPTAIDRINFIKHLKRLGFWVSVRIQPLIDIEQALHVVRELSHVVDYITVEHLKIPTDNKEIKEFLLNIIPNKDDYEYVGRRNYELKKNIKIENIKKIKEVSRCKIGIGDNNLQYLSDSSNCCGLDTFTNNFFKYNSLYINKNGKEDINTPINSCRSCFSSDMRGDCTTVKEYVDKYIEENKDTY